MAAADEQTTKALLSLADNDAVQHADDPAMLGGIIARKRATLADYGKRQGWTPEATQAAITDAVSAAHMGVLEHLLNNEQDLKASSYLAAHRSEFAAKDLNDADRLTEAGSVRAESQRLSDDITSRATSLSAALDRVKQTQDPRVRDQLEQRVRRHFADVQADRLQARAEAFQQASSILERTGDYGQVPLRMRVLMTPEENGALQHREDQIRHPQRTTNQGLYMSLMNGFGLPGSRDWLLNQDLSRYRNQLSDEDFNRVIGMQFSGRMQESNAMSSEARRQSLAADREAKKAEQRQQTLKTLEAMGIHIPPTVPGAPLPQPVAPTAGASGNVDLGATPAAPSPGTRPTSRVPQTWLEHAKRDPNYRLYLQHMGVQVP
jgi:hypothetical protein